MSTDDLRARAEALVKEWDFGWAAGPGIIDRIEAALREVAAPATHAALDYGGRAVLDGLVYWHDRGGSIDESWWAAAREVVVARPKAPATQPAPEHRIPSVEDVAAMMMACRVAADPLTVVLYEDGCEERWARTRAEAIVAALRARVKP